MLELGALTVIDDAYNANPLSMRLGLDTLAEWATPGQRRVAILGAMAELGPDSPRFHLEIGAYARERADAVVGVGALAQHYGADRLYDTSAACAEQIPKLVRRGDIVFVKGAHSLEMPRVVNALEALATELGSGSPLGRES